jgi:hypothetical protein
VCKDITVSLIEESVVKAAQIKMEFYALTIVRCRMLKVDIGDLLIHLTKFWIAYQKKHVL